MIGRMHGILRGKPSPVPLVDTGGAGRGMDAGAAVARRGRTFANVAGGPR